jgi:ribosome-associated protein
MKLSEEQKRNLEKELVFSATRSSGPGGQNVNKVNSRIELRFDIEHSEVFDADEKNRIFLKLKNHINSEGELVLFAQTSRSQTENRKIAIDRFYSLLEKALTLQKKRMKTKPTLSSRLKRLESKKYRSVKKQLRKPPET